MAKTPDRGAGRGKKTLALPTFEEAPEDEATESEDTPADLGIRRSLEALKYVPWPPVPPRSYRPRGYSKIPVLRKRRLPPILDHTGKKEIDKRADSYSMSKLSPDDGHSTVSFGTRGQSYSSQRKFTGPVVAKGIMLLNPDIIMPNPPPVWQNPNENISGLPPLMVLRRTRSFGIHHSRMLVRSFEREIGALLNFQKAKGKQLLTEDHVKNKSGKTREYLLLRRNQLLPRLSGTGFEKTHVTIERTVTPENFRGPDLFNEESRLSKERNGICYTKSRKEQGYDVIDEWVGCPEVTDYIRHLLNPQSDICQNLRGDDFPESSSLSSPAFPGLGVVGLKYEEVQKCIQKGRSLIDKASIGTKVVGLEGISSTIKQTEQFDHSKTTVTSSSKYYLEEDPIPAEVSLILSSTQLSWSEDPSRADKVYVIELGCTADMGRNSVGSVKMINTGTTAIHFHWVKVPHTDPFQLSKYNLRRFVFDCWGGTILPGEVFRVPFLYRCIESGFYSEDWKLMTQPILENGAEIILRLWGITRQYDPYQQDRRRIDELLLNRMSQAIVRHRVGKIVDYLPLKEVPLKDIRFTLVHLGPDLFHFNNPWLKYHCAEVYRLGELAHIVDERRERRRQATLAEGSETVFSVETEGESSSESASISHLSPVSFGLEDTEDEEEDDESSDTDLYPQQLPNISLSFMAVPGSSWDNIRFLKRTLMRQINPDSPHLKHPTVEPDPFATDTSPSLADKVPKAAINLTNADFRIDEMRASILKDCDDRLEFQEALFLIMSEQIARLSFRPDVPVENWKLTVARGLLCDAMDSFSNFAMTLRLVCCESQIRKGHQRLDLHSSSIATDTVESSNTTSNAKTKKFVTESAVSVVKKAASVVRSMMSTAASHAPQERSKTDVLTMEVCPFTNPRTALDYDRFQDQYYARLHTRMYELLVDFVETLDALLYEDEKNKKLDWSRIGFTTVKEIPMKVSIAGILEAPLPPRWVYLAQRMDNTQKMIRARKLALDEADQALADQGEKDPVKPSKKGQSKDSSMEVQSETKRPSQEDESSVTGKNLARRLSKDGDTSGNIE